MNGFMPKVLIGALVLFSVVVGGFIFFRSGTFKNQPAASPLPEASTLAASAENSGNLGEYYDGSEGANASVSATPAPSPQPIREYIYPGAETVSSTSVKLELETTDNAAAVTEWYKNKIKELQFNAQSFSSTNTNGVIFNKLSAAKPGEKIEVTIKKDQNTSNVLITVDRL
jgi:hypothetical protein